MTPEERAVELWDKWDHRQSFVVVVAEAIRKAVAEEREACAKIADEFRYPSNDVAKLDGRGDEADDIAAAIRERSAVAPPAAP